MVITFYFFISGDNILSIHVFNKSVDLVCSLLHAPGLGCNCIC